MISTIMQSLTFITFRVSVKIALVKFLPCQTITWLASPTLIITSTHIFHVSQKFKPIRQHSTAQPKKHPLKSFHKQLSNHFYNQLSNRSFSQKEIQSSLVQYMCNSNVLTEYWIIFQPTNCNVYLSFLSCVWILAQDLWVFQDSFSRT